MDPERTSSVTCSAHNVRDCYTRGFRLTSGCRRFTAQRVVAITDCPYGRRTPIRFNRDAASVGGCTVSEVSAIGAASVTIHGCWGTVWVA